MYTIPFYIKSWAWPRSWIHLASRLHDTTIASQRLIIVKYSGLHLKGSQTRLLSLSNPEGASLVLVVPKVPVEDSVNTDTSSLISGVSDPFSLQQTMGSFPIKLHSFGCRLCLISSIASGHLSRWIQMPLLPLSRKQSSSVNFWKIDFYHTFCFKSFTLFYWDTGQFF